jgi:hypothetical protein
MTHPASEPDPRGERDLGCTVSTAVRVIAASSLPRGGRLGYVRQMFQLIANRPLPPAFAAILMAEPHAT